MRRTIVDAPHGEEDNEINLTPMLDVVFIMLIFFIVTASFVKEAGIDVDRPDALTAIAKGSGSMFVAISGNNEIWIDRRKIAPQAVRANLERLRAENPEGSVVIQADRDAHSEALLLVMSAARDIGAEVSIAAINE
jgi:biopolymer transport protein ExbD